MGHRRASLILALALGLAGCSDAAWQIRPSREAFDARLAAGYVGKYVLVTLTYCDPDGDVVTQQQVHGIITKADPARGFAVALQGLWEGETFWLPPDMRSFLPARRGEYRLFSTSEIIYDPDLISTWEITRPVPWL